MGKRVFSREFKLEAVKLVLERGVAESEAARQLGILKTVKSPDPMVKNHQLAN